MCRTLCYGGATRCFTAAFRGVFGWGSCRKIHFEYRVSLAERVDDEGSKKKRFQLSSPTTCNCFLFVVFCRFCRPSTHARDGSGSSTCDVCVGRMILPPRVLCCVNVVPVDVGRSALLAPGLGRQRSCSSGAARDGRLRGRQGRRTP